MPTPHTHAHAHTLLPRGSKTVEDRFAYRSCTAAITHPYF